MLCVVRMRSLRRADHPYKRALPSKCCVVLCDLETSRMKKSLSALGWSVTEKKIPKIFHNLSPFAPFLTQKWINLNYCGRLCMSIFQYVSPSIASGTFIFSFESRTYTEPGYSLPLHRRPNTASALHYTETKRNHFLKSTSSDRFIPAN